MAHKNALASPHSHEARHEARTATALPAGRKGPVAVRGLEPIPPSLLSLVIPLSPLSLFYRCSLRLPMHPADEVIACT